MKLGRLAVDSRYAKQGIGQFIIKYVMHVFTHGNRTGCRVLTVDAYVTALGFYESCGFRYFTETDEGDDTRLMFYDLKNFML